MASKAKRKEGGTRKGLTKADKAARDAALAVARIADEMRGRDIVVLHVEKAILVTDYFVIVSARNRRQIQAMTKEITGHFRKEASVGSLHVEGYEEASWVLIDAGRVVVHIFREDLRRYYDLELLWGDSPKLKWREKKA
ncbi:MAG: ribosome silencing factor [Planctomycetota bacterium]